MTDEKPAGTRPKYMLIADDLASAIYDGAYPPGSDLPTKKQLTERYRERFGTTSDGTIAHAIRELRNRGLVESTQGKRVSVADPLPDRDAPSEVEQLHAALEAMREEFFAEIGELRRRLEAGGL